MAEFKSKLSSLAPSLLKSFLTVRLPLHCTLQWLIYMEIFTVNISS